MVTRKQEILTGERALFSSKDLVLDGTVFRDGESPLKESENIELNECVFEWKYPLWYCKNIQVKNTHWLEMARAGVWYTRDISVRDSIIEAPKNFRRCTGVKLKNVFFPNAAETLWNCADVSLENVSARGDYFGMNCQNVRIKDFDLAGNYSFDGVRDLELCGGRLLSKDAFWNAENVTVKNAFISGEYLGWNSKNLTFIDCVIESLQGLCYIENLVMKNCRLINTDRAFEYSTVRADLRGRADSVVNPYGGEITADAVGSLILDPRYIDPEKTVINERKNYEV